MTGHRVHSGQDTGERHAAHGIRALRGGLERDDHRPILQGSPGWRQPFAVTLETTVSDPGPAFV